MTVTHNTVSSPVPVLGTYEYWVLMSTRVSQVPSTRYWAHQRISAQCPVSPKYGEPAKSPSTEYRVLGFGAFPYRVPGTEYRVLARYFLAPTSPYYSEGRSWRSTHSSA